MEELNIKSENGATGNGQIKAFFPSDEQICIEVSETSSFNSTGWSAIQFINKSQAKQLGQWLIQMSER